MRRPRRCRRFGLIAPAAVVAGCLSQSPERFDKPRIVDVQRGLSSVEIAELLVDENVLSHKWGFLWKRVRNRSAKLMAGEYVFERPMSADEVFEKLANGRVRLYPLTVPEGLNRFEIAELVGKKGIGTEAEFLALTALPGPIKDLLPEATTLEGALFPDTYYLSKASTVHDLVRSMLRSFREALAEARKHRTVDLSDWDATVLASMIEDETGMSGERPLVSSVFHNRMRRGMLMQCDPTIAYGLMLEGRYRGMLYRRDLSDPTPYNTYVHKGLPPGPITNPGAASLQAAFDPAETDFIFFVARPGYTSGHSFSARLRDHNRAVQALRAYNAEVRAARRADRAELETAD